MSEKIDHYFYCCPYFRGSQERSCQLLRERERDERRFLLTVLRICGQPCDSFEQTQCPVKESEQHKCPLLEAKGLDKFEVVRR